MTAVLHLSRRRFLALGATALATACADDSTPAADPATTTAGEPSATTSSAAASTAAPVEPVGPSPLAPHDFDGVGTCNLLRVAPAGPFPLEEQFERHDLTDGHPGHPLRLGFRVVDADCIPLAGATVEVWHTDATGDYSAFIDGGGGKDEGPGTTFCRGTQTAGDDGIVEFLTLYPGWYPGRAPHVHLRVRLPGEPELTSQVYFDDEYTAEVYAEDPYVEFGLPDTTTAADGLAGDVVANGSRLALRPAPTELGDGTLALLALGVA